MIEDFLEKEMGGGQVVGGESAFTLDPEKVRERVSVFCRENSLYPLLRCLQAVISVCKGDIFIQREEKSWDIRFRWPKCPDYGAFRDLLELGVTAGFDQVGHRVGQHLFFGLSAAMGSSDYRVEWRSPKGSFRLKNKTLQELEPIEGEYLTLHFGLEASWWNRLLNQQSTARLEDELRRRIIYCPKPVHLNRELLVPTPPEAPERPWASKLM